MEVKLVLIFLKCRCNYSHDLLVRQKSLSLQHYKFKTQRNERTSIKGNARGWQARLCR